MHHQTVIFVNLILTVTFALSDVVIGFQPGLSLTVTESINVSASVCPQILQGILEREVSVFASSMDITARGICPGTTLKCHVILYRSTMNY